MVTVVVVLNVLLALYGFYLTRHVWNLRRAFARATATLIVAERSTHRVLYGAPEAIRRGQLGTQQLRQNYQQLEPKLQRAQQALALVGLGRSLLLNPALARRLQKSTPKRKTR